MCFMNEMGGLDVQKAKVFNIHEDLGVDVMIAIGYRETRLIT